MAHSRTRFASLTTAATAALTLLACGQRTPATAPAAGSPAATVAPTSAPALLGTAPGTAPATAPATASTDATARRPTTVEASTAKDAVFTPWTLPTTFQPIAIPPAFLPPWLAGTPFGAPPTGSAPIPAPTAAPTAAPSPAATAVAVFLYGHPTCGACKLADEHMKAKAIAYVYRNIDDDAANREMWTKLRNAGKDGSSCGIPVIDVDGDLLIGWSESSFDKMYATAAAKPKR